MIKLNQEEVIKRLKDKGFNVVDGAHFSESHKGSIWFKISDNVESEELKRIELSWDCGNENNFPITDILESYGWYAESYDPETLFAYKV